MIILYSPPGITHALSSTHKIAEMFFLCIFLRTTTKHPNRKQFKLMASAGCVTNVPEMKTSQVDLLDETCSSHPKALPSCMIALIPNSHVFRLNRLLQYYH